jgi:hypothetical protein
MDGILRNHRKSRHSILVKNLDCGIHRLKFCPGFAFISWILLSNSPNLPEPVFSSVKWGNRTFLFSPEESLQELKVIHLEGGV